MMEQLLGLLRLGLGTSSIENENLSNYIMMPESQWIKIGETAQGQGVLGVMLDGVERLESISYGATRELSKELKLEWIGNVLNNYEVRNQHQMAVINDLQKRWAEAGLSMMVMKGQAMGTYYPNPKHRAPGDIDCYLFDSYVKGNELAKEWADKVNEGWYKHSVISYKGETIENHQFFVHTREGKRSKQLQKKLEEALKVEEWKMLPQSEVLLPPVQWNAMFLTYHACAHFLSEGMRMKQILDWALFLQREQNSVDWISFYDFCNRYHFDKFADVMTSICVNKLGVKIKNPNIRTESPFTEKVLNSTLFDEDYIYNSGESTWKGRLHVVRSLFKYKWKYDDIYEESVLKQLWWYVSGYLLHTEY